MVSFFCTACDVLGSFTKTYSFLVTLYGLYYVQYVPLRPLHIQLSGLELSLPLSLSLSLFSLRGRRRPLPCVNSEGEIDRGGGERCTTKKYELHTRTCCVERRPAGETRAPTGHGPCSEDDSTFFFSEPRTYVRRGEGGEIMYLECEASTALDATSSGVCGLWLHGWPQMAFAADIRYKGPFSADT